MSLGTQYTAYHPKWYRRPMSVWWWLQNRSYFYFVLRELTSVFVGLCALLLLWHLRALVGGPEAHAHFLAQMRRPFFVALNSVGLIFILFHTITWFNLAPKAMVVRLGGKRVPDWTIAGLNYVAWVLLSVAVAAVLLRG